MNNILLLLLRQIILINLSYRFETCRKALTRRIKLRMVICIRICCKSNVEHIIILPTPFVWWRQRWESSLSIGMYHLRHKYSRIIDACRNFLLIYTETLQAKLLLTFLEFILLFLSCCTPQETQGAVDLACILLFYNRFYLKIFVWLWFVIIIIFASFDNYEILIHSLTIHIMLKRHPGWCCRPKLYSRVMTAECLLVYVSVKIRNCPGHDFLLISSNWNKMPLLLLWLQRSGHKLFSSWLNCERLMIKIQRKFMILNFTSA